MPIHNLFHRDRGFTGRTEQLAQLRKRLASGGAAVVQAVHGMGGVGKTPPVLEYAHRHLNEYDVVWWISAEQTSAFGKQFTDLGVALGIVGGSTVAKARCWSTCRAGARWLLIFDNAVDREDVTSWLPRDTDTDTGDVLIAYRSGDRHPVAQTVEIDVLPRQEAVDFLTGRLPSLDPVAADETAVTPAASRT